MYVFMYASTVEVLVDRPGNLWVAGSRDVRPDDRPNVMRTLGGSRDAPMYRTDVVQGRRREPP